MTDPTRYDNPLVTRYATRAMAELWGPQRKHATWRRLWVALAEAEHELGLRADDGVTPRIRPEQLEELYDLLEWTWGTRDIAFSDPMSGGGSIPFEALRYGLTVHANELNPVASVILKATLDYPARFGSSLITDIRKYGDLWAKKVRERLERFLIRDEMEPDDMARRIRNGLDASAFRLS